MVFYAFRLFLFLPRWVISCLKPLLNATDLQMFICLLLSFLTSRQICIFSFFLLDVPKLCILQTDLGIHPSSTCCCCCSVSKSCPTLCDPMDCSTPGFPVLYYLPEFAQTYVHCVGKAIQLSHSTSPSFPLWLMMPYSSSSQAETLK